MFKVFALARTTLREMLREKVFFIAVVIAVVLQALSLLLGALSLAEQQKILADFGFVAIQVSLQGVSLFFGAYLLAKEIEKQTCLLILSRPVSRDQFLVGKILGVTFLNTMLVTSLAVLLAILLKLWSYPQAILHFAIICLSLWLESLVILSFVIMVSLIVRPVLALSSGIMIFILGHWLNDLMFFAEKSKEVAFINGVKVLHWITPNFYKMNWKSYYFLNNGIPVENVGWMVVHTVGWIVIFILAANFLFRRKDIV